MTMHPDRRTLFFRVLENDERFNYQGKLAFFLFALSALNPASEDMMFSQPWYFDVPIALLSMWVSYWMAALVLFVACVPLGLLSNIWTRIENLTHAHHEESPTKEALCP